jgi:hypothetical protein
MDYVYSIPAPGQPTARAMLARKYGLLLELHNRYRMQSRVRLMLGVALALDVVRDRISTLDNWSIAA